MAKLPIQLLLADDDKDDCLFFEEVLHELPVSTQLTTLHDGEQLMNYLTKQQSKLPQVLFLDLNIPRKNGLECLELIRSNKKFSSLPVIIYSTSSEEKIIQKLHQGGAHYFIRKPTEFQKLKRVIEKALNRVTQLQTTGSTVKAPPLNEFVLTSES